MTIGVDGKGRAGAFAAHAALFGESASTVLVSVAPDERDAVLGAARAAGVPAAVIGETGGDRIRISVDGALAVDRAVREAETAWATEIERRMARRAGS